MKLSGQTIKMFVCVCLGAGDDVRNGVDDGGFASK